MNSLKDVPYAIFLMACGVFGELCIRMPTDHFAHQFFIWPFGAAAALSGGLFFSKTIIGWPRIPGLNLIEPLTMSWCPNPAPRVSKKRPSAVLRARAANPKVFSRMGMGVYDRERRFYSYPIMRFQKKRPQ